MGFIVLPASIADIREVYDVYFTTFEGELVTEILFPWDVRDETFRQGHEKHTLEYWHKDANQYTYKCIDTDTGAIVGMALFDVFWKELEAEKRKLPPVDWLQGEQKQRAEGFIRPFWQRKEEVIAGKAHVYCHVVAVLPEYQRRGIGTLLMRPCVDASRQLGVTVYCEATPEAMPLYKKLKFEKLATGVHLGPDVIRGKALEVPVMVLQH